MFLLPTLVLWFSTLAAPPPAAPPSADDPATTIELPGVTIDRDAGEVAVDAEVIDVQMPLEFFCVVAGSSEHESVLRTTVAPSRLHAAMLAAGFEPGQGANVDDDGTLHPPAGEALSLSVRWQRPDGRVEDLPANRLLRSVRTGDTAPPMTWVYTGSRVIDVGPLAGRFGADVSGYVVSVVNFDLTLIDVPAIVSDANETLEWELNRAADLPTPRTPVRLVIRRGALVVPDGTPTP